MEKIWIKNYPKGVPEEIDPSAFKSIVDVFDHSCSKFGSLPAFKNMGSTLSFNDLDCYTYQMASFLTNHLGLKKGDRIAIQLPNLLQTPIAIFGALRAGLVVVNTNPLYTAREMKHQFNDSGAKAIIILVNFAFQLQSILKDTQIEKVVVTEAGDCLAFPKNLLVNAALKYVKKAVPSYHIPGAISYKDALEIGKKQPLKAEDISGEDLAFLQYTGGTTGVSKGAMLTHRNIVANMEQSKAWFTPQLREGTDKVITALPLYHIFALTVNCLTFMKVGGCNILITNPRDVGGFIKELQKHQFTVLTGVNTLFAALMNHPQFSKVDWSTNKVSIAGGMSLQKAVTDQWYVHTGQVIAEGYGLTETSPIVACNPLDVDVDGKVKVGSVGLPLPSTEIKFIDEDGKDTQGPGELCCRGPQVMKGYWKRPEETKQVLSEDGWLRTGDIAVMGDDGYLKIIDRKKDMILVSGFNVYPNEVEDVIAMHSGVMDVAAIGVQDERSGEAVKVFIVRKENNKVSEKEILQHCKKELVAYKVPKYIEFRESLPKTHIGKVLRRALK